MSNNNPEDDSEDFLEDEVEEEELLDTFPTLFQEIKSGEQNIVEQEARTSSGSKKLRRFQSYTPGVSDFLCRCKSEKEAEEIIEFLLKKGDITEEHAQYLQKQLDEKGLEFFGEHRAPGYYDRV